MRSGVSSACRRPFGETQGPLEDPGFAEVDLHAGPTSPTERGPSEGRRRRCWLPTDIPDLLSDGSALMSELREMGPVLLDECLDSHWRDTRHVPNDPVLAFEYPVLIVESHLSQMLDDVRICTN